MRPRSVPYPSIRLRKAVVLAERLRAGLEKGLRGKAAFGGNTNNGALGRAIGSLRQYGLVHGRVDKLDLTPLGRDVLSENRAVRAAAMREALAHPEIFAVLERARGGEAARTAALVGAGCLPDAVATVKRIYALSRIDVAALQPPPRPAPVRLPPISPPDAEPRLLADLPRITAPRADGLCRADVLAFEDADISELDEEAEYPDVRLVGRTDFLQAAVAHRLPADDLDDLLVGNGPGLRFAAIHAGRRFGCGEALVLLERRAAMVFEPAGRSMRGRWTVHYRLTVRAASVSGPSEGAKRALVSAAWLAMEIVEEDAALWRRLASAADTQVAVAVSVSCARWAGGQCAAFAGMLRSGFGPVIDGGFFGDEAERVLAPVALSP